VFKDPIFFHRSPTDGSALRRPALASLSVDRLEPEMSVGQVMQCLKYTVNANTQLRLQAERILKAFEPQPGFSILLLVLRLLLAPVLFRLCFLCIILIEIKSGIFRFFLPFFAYARCTVTT
jgi:hypothetical protein